MQGDLKLVTDFATLQTSDMVVVKCDHPRCGKTHTGLLLNPEEGWPRGPDGLKRYASRMFPLCKHRYGRVFNVTPFTVARRIVYKVETGVEDEYYHVPVFRRKPASLPSR